MQMAIHKFSKTGAYHTARHEENQDCLYSIEGKDFLAVMLADGATTCERSLEGARLSCEAMAQVIRLEGSRFFHYPKEKIAYLLTEQILYFLERGKLDGCDIREYGSTFSLVFLEKDTGRTVLVNLGDSAVIAVGENGFFYLLRPKRYRGAPCLTTTDGAGRAIEVAVRTLAPGDSILVCSDGFLDQLQKDSVASLLNSYDTDGLDRQLSLLENEDDCSYISFTRRRD